MGVGVGMCVGGGRWGKGVNVYANAHKNAHVHPSPTHPTHPPTHPQGNLPGFYKWDAWSVGVLLTMLIGGDNVSPFDAWLLETRPDQTRPVFPSRHY